MDPSRFAGMSWDVWENHVKSQNKEQFVKPESNVNKLPKEDMKIFGLVVDAEPLSVRYCEKCGMLVKSEALLHHYTTRHSGILAEASSCDQSSAKAIEMKDDSDVASSYSGNLIVKGDDCGSTSEFDVNENMKDSNKLVSPPVTAPRRLKRLETNRSPLGQMCPNKWHYKKNRLKERIFPLLNTKDASLRDEKMETNSETDETNDGVDYLLHQLPEMSLNSAVEEQARGDDATESDSPPNISYLPNPPRALSATPFFSCHKAGGLLYPGRHMKMTRQMLQQMFSSGVRIRPHILRHIKTQRKNVLNRRRKEK